MGTSTWLQGFIQLKTWTQKDSGTLQEFAIAIELLIHHAFPAQHPNHLCRGLGKAFGKGIRDQGYIACMNWSNELVESTAGTMSWL
jgi:hypothetical protein